MIAKERKEIYNNNFKCFCFLKKIAEIFFMLMFMNFSLIIISFYIQQTSQYTSFYTDFMNDKFM